MLLSEDASQYAYAQPNVALDDLTEPTGGESAEQVFEVAEAARLAVITLTGRQLRVLRDRPQTTLEELAAKLGVRVASHSPGEFVRG